MKRQISYFTTCRKHRGENTNDITASQLPAGNQICFADSGGHADPRRAPLWNPGAKTVEGRKRLLVRGTRAGSGRGIVSTARRPWGSLSSPRGRSVR